MTGTAERGGRRLRGWVRAAAGAAILAVLVWRVGLGPFVTGLRQVGPVPVAAALSVGVLTTWCCAWRRTASTPWSGSVVIRSVPTARRDGQTFAEKRIFPGDRDAIRLAAVAAALRLIVGRLA